MLEKLLELYEKLQTEKQSMTFELTHDKVMDWYIRIYHRDSKTEIYSGNGMLEDTICEAYLALRKWETENY